MKKFYRESGTTKEELRELLEALKEAGVGYDADILLDYFNKGDLKTVWQGLRGCTYWFERKFGIEIEREGVAIGWHPNGNLQTSCNFKDGERDGKFEGFYSDGKLAERYNYKYGMRDGKYERFYPNGNLQTSCNFKDGERDGKFEGFYSDGTLWERCNYKDGKLDGKYERWTEDGKLRERRNFKNDKYDGKWECFSPDGTLEISRNFKDDELDGECKEWNEDGELIVHELYDMGELVKDYLKYAKEITEQGVLKELCKMNATSEKGGEILDKAIIMLWLGFSVDEVKRQLFPI